MAKKPRMKKTKSPLDFLPSGTLRYNATGIGDDCRRVGCISVEGWKCCAKSMNQRNLRIFLLPCNSISAATHAKGRAGQGRTEVCGGGLCGSNPSDRGHCPCFVVRGGLIPHLFDSDRSIPHPLSKDQVADHPGA